MTTTSPIQGFPLPAMSDPPANYAANWQTIMAGPDGVEGRLVMKFADSSERDSKITSGNRRAGQLCWLTSPGTFSFYDGTEWYNQPRARQVANRAARDAITSKRIGDLVTESDTGWSFLWSGTRWQGLHSHSYDGTISQVNDIDATEVTVSRLTIPDQGCTYRATIYVSLQFTKDTPGDTFVVNLRNGTGLVSPALAGGLIGQIVYEANVNSLTRSWHGIIELDKTTSYDIVVNVQRTDGTGLVDVAASADQVFNRVRAIAHPV